jgi:hemerythrin-like domain-containing protein
MHTSELTPSTTKASHTPDALQLLLESHKHIRTFAALAAQLGEPAGKSPAELAETASRVIRYFTLGLPLHVEDEDYALVPHLFATSLPPEMLKAMWEIGRQHEELELVVDELVPVWATLRDMPERHAELARHLRVEGARLQQLVEEHLTLEEQQLFPLIQERLSPETLAVIGQEILDRRGQLS